MLSKPWYAPFRMMLTIFILIVLFNIVLLATYRHLPITGQMLFYLILWPVVVLGETILYWVLRTKLKERKLVWVHLIFSLFGFVLMRFIFVFLPYVATHLIYMPEKFFYYIQFIGFWGSMLIAHAALIVALVRSLSVKEQQPPADCNDLLSEIHL